MAAQIQPQALMRAAAERLREELALAEARVDLGRLERNIAIVKRKLEGRAKLLAVVKADAYGHGAVPVAKRAEEAGADMFGVASLAEALELREAGLERPILILGLPPAHPRHLPLLAELGELGISLTLDSLELARALAREARRRGTRPKVHLKVDTGLGRIGVRPERALSLMRQLARLRPLQVEGIFSHFSAAASAAEADRRYTFEQLERFEELLDQLDRAGLLPELRHIANSAGLIGYLDRVTSGRLNLVRSGILLYGYPEVEADWTREIKPVLSLHTRVVSVRKVPAGSYLGYGRTYRATRPMRVAVLPVGYGDGLDLRLSNRGWVVIRGRRAPIVGRISMDQTLVDITHLGKVEAGDEVELIGDRLPASELAELLGLGCIEPILTSISRRVRRVYLN